MLASRLARGRRSHPVVAFLALAVLVGGCSSPKTTPRAAPPPREPVPVTFDVPPGFAFTTNYRILVPLHPLRETRWVVPAGTQGFDVIAVTSYVLDADVAADRFPDALSGYADKVAATSVTSPVPTTVDDYPALQQTVVQPSSSGPLTYDATFVFAGPNLVQVICQYDGRPDMIKTACSTVLDTLHIGFA